MRGFWIAGVMAAAAWLLPANASAATQLLPDLGMAKLSTVKIDTTTMPGHRLLRYTAKMVNVGAGALQVNGTRPDTSSSMTVTQRIFSSDGTHTDEPKPLLSMDYSGDGHNHWHTIDAEGGTLKRLDNGVIVGTLAKHGFCFFDNVQYNLSLPGAPGSAFYTSSNSCAFGAPNALSVMMGLSVGWGDNYSASTNFQWIDITGLPNGKYKLTATADSDGTITESNYSNNSAWATLRIRNDRVSVLTYGPGA